MNKKSKWNQIDSQNLPMYIKADDYCVYAREYKAQKGYKGGQTNSLITNFKKSPDTKKTKQWPHRMRAIKTFSKEIELLFKSNSNVTITAIPSSKSKDHPKYDHRFEDLFKELLKSRTNLNIEWPIEIKETIESSHSGGIREPEIFKQNFHWTGFKQTPPKILFIIDDVLTTGAHFRAMSDFLRENSYNGKIVGIFWAKTVWPSIEEDEDWIELNS